MTTTQCIVLCGGDNSRWNGYRNCRRKHLIEIEGELLLRRTVRLLATRESVRTAVVVNENDVDLYRTSLPARTELYAINPDLTGRTEADKFLSSRELWNAAGRTIVLLGDVWFSDEAMKKIFNQATHDWTAFGRAGASRVTGRPHGELFAQSFTVLEEHGNNLARLDAMYRDGTCRRAASGWAHYQLMIGSNPNIHTVGPRFVEIDDFTDDFDCPQDYDSWVRWRSLKRPEPRGAPTRTAILKIGRNELCSCGSGRKFKRCCGR